MAGYFSQIYKDALKGIEDAYGKNVQVIENAAGVANREMDANTDISATRGGYMGTGLYNTLITRNKARVLNQKSQALTQLGAQHEQNVANMNLEAGKAALQDNAASETSWQNILANAGSLLGMGLKIFGGPAGIAAGTGLDAASGAINATTNLVPDLVSKYKIPGLE